MVVWLVLFTWIISLTLLLFNVWLFFWEVVLLIDSDVHLFDQEAISWDSVSLLKINNITNNEFSNWDFFNGSVSTSVDTNFLIVDFFSKLQKLSFFPPVTETCDKADKQKTSVDSQRLYVSSCWSSENRCNKINCGSPTKHDAVGIFKLSGRQFKETFNLWHCNLVFPKNRLSSNDIHLISDKTCLWIRWQKLAEAIIIPTFFKHVQWNPLFPFIVRTFKVFLIEKLIELFRIKSENVFNTLFL